MGSLSALLSVWQLVQQSALQWVLRWEVVWENQLALLRALMWVPQLVFA
jgi:hypothetical protein